MAVLINAHNLSCGFAGKELFSKLSLGVETGQRIGLIGPNGAGKSTLLKILLGKHEADAGTISKKQGLRFAYLEQTPTLDESLTIHETLLSAAIDPHDWEAISQAQELYSKFGFEEAGLSTETLVKSLSGGWRKKTALARELMRNPELFFLDEPTNHLDVESILWLEEYLSQAPFATLTITHDRLFLNRVSNIIWELDKRNVNGLLKIDGDYATYCEVKGTQIATQERHEETLKNTLRRETEWLRRGPKARTTKQQARIDRAYELEESVSQLENVNKVLKVGILFEGVEGGPKKLIEAKNISKSYTENGVTKALFKDFSVQINRGKRIGLLGTNGSGKSTLIRVLLKQEEPDKGEVQQSENIEVAYFSQNRETLDPNATVMRTLCPQGDHVKFNGNFIHIRSYLDRFLFHSQQMDSPVSKLSGGEQARLLIAKLMLTQANLLVLDEPTNDLDLATLNILEERLKEFDGAVILVTHDRYFLDQVVDTLYAFGCHDDPAKIESFVGILQWEEWKRNRLLKKSAPKAIAKEESTTPVKKKALTYKDQRELDSMAAVVEKAEEELANLVKESTRPENVSNSQKLSMIMNEMAKVQSQIEKLYARWQELEKMTQDS